MKFRNDPVFASTVFSVGLHLALLLALLQLPAISLPTGNSLRIELMRSLAAPGQIDAVITEQAVQPPKVPVGEQMQALDDSLKTRRVANDPARSRVQAQPRPAQRQVATSGGDRTDGADRQTAVIDAETRTAAMLELLHDAISDHRRYPYLARRQRREGTAQVELYCTRTVVSTTPRCSNPAAARYLTAPRSAQSRVSHRLDRPNIPVARADFSYRRGLPLAISNNPVNRS